MADVTISDLPSGSSIQSGDRLEVERSGVSYYALAGAVAAEDVVPVGQGGTNSTTAGDARAALGVQAQDADLDALAALGVTGLLVRTGDGAAAARAITAGGGITVSDGDGINGDPTIDADVTSVAGKTGAVSLVASDVGLGNVPNADATVDVADSGAAVQTTTNGINFAGNLGVTDDGDGTVSVAVTGLATVAETGDYGDLFNTPSIPAVVDDLGDVDTATTAPSSGDVLEWDGSNWVPAAISGGGVDVEDGGTTVVGGASAINAGTRLGVTDDGDGTVTLDASVPVDSVAGKTGAVTLAADDLGDVDTSTTAPASGDYLTWDGSAWVPTATASSISGIDDLDDVDTSTTAPSSGDVLEWDGSNWVPAAVAGGVDVEDDGSTVVSGASAINAGTQLAVTDDGDGTVTLDGNAPVDSVAGKTGTVSLVAGDVGLGNVTNDAQVVDAGGAVSVRIDTSANLPSAGTAGRLYVETDGDHRLLYDDGTAWIEKGRQPAMIGSADLAFDPATQAELDGHTGDTANPHSVTASQVGLGNVPDADATVDIEDGGAAVQTTTNGINFAANLGVTDDGDGTVTVDVTGLATVATSGAAVDVSYDNSGSGLAATDVKAALDELDSDVSGHAGSTSNPHGVTLAQALSESGDGGGNVAYNVQGRHQALGQISSDTTLDVSAYVSFAFEPTASLTISFTGWSGGLHQAFVQVTGGGDYPPTFSGVSWDGGSAPSLQTGSGVDLLAFWSVDGGTTVYGKHVAAA